MEPHCIWKNCSKNIRLHFAHTMYCNVPYGFYNYQRSPSYTAAIDWFLRAVVKSRNRPVTSSRLRVSLSVRQCFHPHRTTVLPLDGFPRNLIFKGFSKVYQKFRVSWKYEENNGTLQYDLGPAVAQWLRCCATNRKVAGSRMISDAHVTV